MTAFNKAFHGARRVIRVSVAGAIFAAGLSAQAQSETLADALVDAYRNSGLLDQNRALLRAADEEVAQTVAGLRPIMNWTADVTRTFSEGRGGTPGLGTVRSGDTDANLGLSAELLLYDFGRTRFQVEAAKENVLATRQTLVGIEQQVLLRAVQAFMNVNRNYELVSLRENNLRLIGEELRAARERFEVGEVTRTDVAQAEARRAESESQLAVARGDLSQAIEEYTAAIGHPPQRLTSAGPLPTLDRSEESAKIVALRHHPDIRKVQHDIAAAELNVRAAEAAMKPRVSLNGTLGLNEELNSDSYGRNGSFGVNVTGPIYQGGRLSATVRRTIAQRDALRGALHVTRHTVRADVGIAYAVLRAARAQVEASRARIRAARVAFRGVQEEAKVGSRTTLDVLNAEQELLDAQATLISAQADVYIAAYAVLESMGQLTVRDLNLAVQTYDPAAYYNLVKDAPTVTSRQGQKLDRVLKALGKE
ncbi:TolC family outer membrane protein [Roseovarius sp. SCSIO 43702]|uniref:TolC family outer membrane protein n=1 Tax=Roseovarius sp. SCSIO 43702 TaxID=2823043 RepID=UPI001C73AD9C|nr:TolC family outer membrane protein [Roseovarius sp. SCSIO 43702]QYX56762.1 TolC family outer membrane protein [Roseovarius sp. SCSIO 43702]